MPKNDPLPTIISLVSLAVAFAALMISWQAKQIQRAEHKLHRQTAEEKGRLKLVEGLNRNRSKQLGIGFKVLNGPDDVTVTRATITMRYTMNRRAAVWRDDTEFTVRIGSDDFGILGITGPKLDFRLASNHEEEWRFPYAVSDRLPTIPPEKDAEEDRDQQIEFTFSVTASGNSKTSEPEYLLSGLGDTRHTALFGYRFKSDTPVLLKPIVLGALANQVIRNIQLAEGPISLPTVEHLARGSINIPSGLENWLVSAWEEAGNFGDEPTETLARMLAKIRSTPLNPRLLKVLVQEFPIDHDLSAIPSTDL